MEAAPQVGTILVRVQVIDMKPQVLDLVLPTYLPAKDLTQRVARDAGLNAFWPDGRRRLYWLRARGRLMGEDERLMDLGVIAGELVYLLPEPPAGSGVLEQVPDYPETRGYTARGVFTLVGAFLLSVAWAVGWGVALSMDRGPAVVLLPGLALGLIACTFARHAFGGAGSHARVAGLGLFIAVALFAVALLVPVGIGEPWREVVRGSAAGVGTTMVGVLLGWLAWWGAVEKLPPKRVHIEEVAPGVAAVVPCGICGVGATADVRMACPHACGREFHTGCFGARQAVHRGPKDKCAVCGATVRA